MWILVTVYVGMSSEDGSWLFEDGQLSVNEVVSIMERYSPDSQLCLVLDTPNSDHLIKQVRSLEGRVVVQTKRRNECLELGNHSNGKFLLEWLKWNNQRGGTRKEPGEWRSSIKPVYATSLYFTKNQRSKLSDKDFCDEFDPFLSFVYRSVHHLPRRLGLAEILSLPLKLYNIAHFRIFPPNVFYSGFGFYFLKQ